MKCKDSNFWIGLGIGSVAGALAYHFSRTEKAKKLEDAICRAIHKANGEAKEFINTAEEEALHVGTKVANSLRGLNVFVFLRKEKYGRRKWLC